MNRRIFLAGASSISLIPLFTPAKAHAWVSTALSIGSTLAGLAAKNHGTDTIGLFLKAQQQKLDLLVDGIADLQMGVAELFGQLQNAKEEIIDEIQDINIKNYNVELLSALNRYQDLVKNNNFDASNEVDQLDLNKIRHDLNESLYKLLSVEKNANAAASLVIPSAIFASMSIDIRVGLSEKRRHSVLQSRYITWLEKMLNPELPNTVMSDFSKYKKAYEEIKFEYENHPLGSKLGYLPKEHQTACYGINEYKPETFRRCESTCLTIDPDTGLLSPALPISTDLPSVAPNSPVDRCGRTTTCTGEDAPARHGNRYKYWKTVELKISNQPNSPVSELKLMSSDSYHTTNKKGEVLDKSTEDLPNDLACKIEKLNLFGRKNSEKRQEKAQKSKPIIKFGSDYHSAAKLLDEINLMRHVLYFHLECIKNCQTTLASLRFYDQKLFTFRLSEISN